MDATGRIVMWSHRASELLGWSEEEATGRLWSDLNLVHPDDMPEANRIAEEVMTGKSTSCINRLRTLTKDGRVIHCDWYSSGLYDSEGNLTSMIGFALDVTERVKNEQALRAMVEGVSANTGDEFFRSLVSHLAEVLDVEWALVGEVKGENLDKVDVLALWETDGFGDAFEYDLVDTPCQNVVNDSVCIYQDRVQQLFPNDQYLVDLGANSYAGIPLKDRDGNTIGLIALLAKQPIQDEKHVRSILELFADRAAAEMARIRAEREMRRGERRFNSLANNEVVGINQSERHGAISFANTATANLMEVDDPAELMGIDVADFLDDHGKEVIRQERAKRLKGQSSAYELQLHGKHGGVRDVMAFGSPIFNEDGEMTSTVGGMVDITKLKNTERALRASEQRFRSYFNLDLVGIAISTVDIKLIDINDEFCRILGYERSEIDQIQWEKITHPDYTEESARNFRLMISGETDGYTMLKRYFRKDGSEIPVRVSLGCTHHDDGSIEHVIALVEDMSEQHAAETAARQSQLRYEALAENAPVGIFRADLQGHCVYVNERWARLSGIRPSVAMGDGWLKAIHRDDTELITLTWNMLIKKQKGCRIECRFRHSNGRTVWVYLQVVTETDESGTVTGFVATATDITERRRTEQRRKQLMRELDHRVKNNLASIKSLVSMTMREAKSMEEFSDTLQSRILAMASAHEAMAEAGWQSVEFAAMVETILKPYFSDSQSIKISGPDVMLSARCALPMSLAIHELAVNAIKHGSLSREGTGRVQVSWTTDTSIHLTWTESGGPEVLRSRRPGSGVQLIKGLVEYQLHGSVNFDYKPEGLCCQIVVPNAITEGPDKISKSARQRQHPVVTQP